MIMELISSVPAWIFGLMLALGALQYFAKIRILPLKKNHAMWLMILGLGGFMVTGGYLSGIVPEQSVETDSGQYAFSISPEADTNVNYDADAKAFTTEQTYNETDGTIGKDDAKFTFSIVRSDESADDAVFSVELDSNPTVTDDNGNTHEMIKTDTDDTPLFKVIDQSDDSFSYESRTFLTEGGGSADVAIEVELNPDFVSAMEEYETKQTMFTVAGEEFTYRELLTSIES